MAMNAGSQAQINVTPLIDVLLVLRIIFFMVITPITPRGLRAQLPVPSDDAPAGAPPALVLAINAAREVRLNRELVPLENLSARLRLVRATRAERTVFVQGDPGPQYAMVALLIDTATVAGASRVALLTEHAMQGR